MSASFAYGASDDGTIRKIDASDGSQEWSYSLGYAARAVEADKYGYVYSASAEATDKLVRLEPDGDVDWINTSESNVDTISGLAVNYAGTIACVTKGATGSSYLSEIDVSDGSATGKMTGGTKAMYRCDVDEISGDFWFGYDDDLYWSDNGSIDYDYEDYNQSYVYDCCVDQGDHVYHVTNNGYFYKSDKDDFSAEYVWRKDYGYTLYSIGVDNDLNVYVGDSSGYVAKYNSNGTEQWDADKAGGSTRRIFPDRNGDLYCGFSDDTLRKLNSSGTQQWSFTSFSDYVYGAACDPWLSVYPATGGMSFIIMGDF